MEYSYQKTLEKYQDVAGKWQVRVLISDDKSVFFKFQKEPTEEEIKAETLKFIESIDKNKQSEIERIDEEIVRLEERKAHIKSKIISKPQV